MLTTIDRLASWLLLGARFVASQQSICSKGNFISTCIYPGFRFLGSNLGMYCQNNEVQFFAYNWTWIDLDLCVANNDGCLVAWNNGIFSDSCHNCHVARSKTLQLTCDCNHPSGNSLSSTLDLNTVIFNIDGAMGCCGNRGSKSWRGPGLQVEWPEIGRKPTVE